MTMCGNLRLIVTETKMSAQGLCVICIVSGALLQTHCWTTSQSLTLLVTSHVLLCWHRLTSLLRRNVTHAPSTCKSSQHSPLALSCGVSNHIWTDICRDASRRTKLMTSLSHSWHLNSPTGIGQSRIAVSTSPSQRCLGATCGATGSGPPNNIVRATSFAACGEWSQL